MKVLIVHHQMALYGGAELVVVRLAHYLQEHGHKVSILAASTTQRPEYRGLDIITPTEEIRWHLWDGTLSSLKEIYRVATSLRKLCAELAPNYDVINVHNFPTIWTVPGKKRIVWMCNEVPDLWHRDGLSRVTNQLLNAGRLADRVIVRSKKPVAVVADENCAKRFRHRYGFSPEVVPYGIDGEFFARATYTKHHNKFTVVQPSMISPSKGQLEVLEATQELDVKVIFAGYYEPTHPYTERLIQRSAGLDVILTGHVSKEALRSLYYSSHVAIFPGKGQGSWLGPFEALAAGVPIIVSPNLSCSELIRKEGLGTVTTDLRSAIQLIRAHHTSYLLQARRGQEFVLKNLTWDKFGARMSGLMK